MSDRTHPASFQARPPSPSSPATGSLKENHRLPISSDHIPQTPTSPPLMSVSDQNDAANFTSTHTSPNQATVHPPNESSPPSSAPMSTQASQQQPMSSTNSFPTPASSVNGYPLNATGDDKDGRKSFNMNTHDVTENSSEHNHTNHERQSLPNNTNTTGRGQQNSDPDAMEVDTEPARGLDISNLGLDSLQKELTSAFHLCKSSPIVTGPDPSVDLVSLYGLGPIAHSVARLDPVTGEKINRLRKSYEGKLKGLGLAGRNKPLKQEPGAPGSLRHMTLWPEEEWQNQKVFGKQIKSSDMDSALQGLQLRAMQMEPGQIPNNDFWEDILGHEKPVKQPASNEHSKKAAPTPSGRPFMQSHAASPHPQLQEAERPRPSRGRKRHYDDNSFAGYGEGFVDDEEDPGFYSNGEGAGKKKRKKDHVAKVSTPMSSSGSYGVGMFGIGAR